MILKIINCLKTTVLCFFLAISIWLPITFISILKEDGIGDSQILFIMVFSLLLFCVVFYFSVKLIKSIFWRRILDALTIYFIPVAGTLYFYFLEGISFEQYFIINSNLINYFKLFLFPFAEVFFLSGYYGMLFTYIISELVLIVHFMYTFTDDY